MANTSSRVVSALSHLYRIIDAGERGFTTAAAGASNQGLKLLLKSYAQQRFQFKNEIQDQIQVLGGTVTQQGSLPGKIHRGRVAIFAAMTIEEDRREKVILKEAALGEKYAVQTYQKTLETALPAAARQVIERQFAEVQKTSQAVNELLDNPRQRTVLRLFYAAADATLAAEALEHAGVPSKSIERIVPDQSLQQYQGRGATVSETMLSGMVGGTLWGILIGILAGLGAEQTTALAWLGTDSALATFVLVAGMTILTAAMVGGLLGLVIGLGTSDDDRVDSRQSARQGNIILRVTADTARTKEVESIMDHVNLHFREPVPQTVRAS